MRSKALIASSILGVVYNLYLIFYFSGTMSGDVSDTEVIGGALASLLVTPHIVMVMLSTIFNILSVALKKTGFALVAGVLFSVSALLMPLYLPFLIPMIILSFVGYTKMKKFNSTNLETEI